MHVQLNTHQLHETATYPINSPIQPAIIEQTARQVFESFSEKLKLALNGRQDRALKLAVDGHVTYKSERIFSVRSESGQQAYLVDLARSFCTCPDSQQGHVCKHRLAAYLVEQSLKAKPPGPSPEPPAQPPDDSLERVRLVLHARSQHFRSAIIYATLDLDGQTLPVEIVELEGPVALVRALPRIDGDRLVPQFPFPEKQSAAQVLASSLTEVRIYR